MVICGLAETPIFSPDDMQVDICDEEGGGEPLEVGYDEEGEPDIEEDNQMASELNALQEYLVKMSLTDFE